MNELVPLLVAVPLAAAFVIVILAHVRGVARLTGLLAALAIAANLVVTIVLWTAAAGDPDYIVSVWAGNWDGPLGIQMVCDGLARLMLVIINFVALAVIIFSRLRTCGGSRRSGCSAASFC